jgi:hypothetical protein
MVADFLRGVGADGTRAVRPGISSDEERRVWLLSGSRPAKRVPMWMLDYAVAILEQIPDRPDQRGRGRPRETATKLVELLRRGDSSTAEVASLVATLDAGREAFETGKPVSKEQIEKRKQKLARRVYRRKHRRDVP